MKNEIFKLFRKQSLEEVRAQIDAEQQRLGQLVRLRAFKKISDKDYWDQWKKLPGINGNRLPGSLP